MSTKITLKEFLNMFEFPQDENFGIMLCDIETNHLLYNYNDTNKKEIAENRIIEYFNNNVVERFSFYNKILIFYLKQGEK